MILVPVLSKLAAQVLVIATLRSGGNPARQQHLSGPMAKKLARVRTTAELRAYARLLARTAPEAGRLLEALSEGRFRSVAHAIQGEAPAPLVAMKNFLQIAMQMQQITLKKAKVTLREEDGHIAKRHTMSFFWMQNLANQLAEGIKSGEVSAEEVEETLKDIEGMFLIEFNGRAKARAIRHRWLRDPSILLQNLYQPPPPPTAHEGDVSALQEAVVPS